MKSIKKMLALVLALVLALSVSLPALADGEHWGAEAYGKWVKAGVLSDTDELAKIDQAVTRSELAAALEEILDWDWDLMAENTFTDLTYTADGKYWSDLSLYTDILRAVGAGVLTGTTDHKILPFDAITRQDACVMLSRAFGFEAAQADKLFADDADISDYARESVYAASAAGYICGKGSNTFDPLGNITFAELATILDRMAEDYPVIADRAGRSAINWLTDGCTEITVATVPTFAGDTSSLIEGAYTYEGGWIETDADGNIITEPTGQKDLNIRLWLPEGTESGDKVPVLLYTFGGSWIRGNNMGIRPFMVEYLVEHGFAVASLTYRYEHEACFPYSLYDLQAQIRYLKIHADELGIDADNMGISGQSAGGYWAAELAVTGNEADLQDPGYVTFEGDQLGMLTEIKYCLCQYGCFNMMDCFSDVDYRIQDWQAAYNQHDRPVSNDPNVMGTLAAGYDVPTIRDAYENGTDDPDLQAMVQRFIDGSPIFNVDEDDASFFFLHGTADPLCPINQACKMLVTLCSAGVENCVMRVCEGMGHGAALHPQYFLEMMEWYVDLATA
ncbi:MAG: S-layer homology domain-containing protein [Oscillospiraceae bacterium]